MPQLVYKNLLSYFYYSQFVCVLFYVTPALLIQWIHKYIVSANVEGGKPTLHLDGWEKQHGHKCWPKSHQFHIITMCIINGWSSHW